MRRLDRPLLLVGRPLVAPVAAGLLDFYTANLWAAWGITRLRSSADYAGPAIRVRRSSDDAETDISCAAGSTALDSAAMLAWSGGDSVYVTTLYDQSGNGREAAQGTSGLQPRIVDAGAYDGKLVFDGTDDVLLSAAGVATSGTTAFIKRTLRRTGTTEIPFAQYVAITAGKNGWFDNHDAAGLNSVYLTAGADPYDNCQFDGAASLRVVAFRFDRASGAITGRVRSWYDGIEQDNSTHNSNSSISGDFTPDPIAVGAFADGTLPCALDFYAGAVYDAALSPTDTVSINAALA